VSGPLVYLNGLMVPAYEAHLAIYDLGVVMGAIVTEQTRTFRKKPFRLEEHVERLIRSLQLARIEIRLGKKELLAISEKLISHNGSLLAAEDDLGLIHFVTAGQHAAYGGEAARTTPTICAHTFPLPFERWARKMESGVHLITPAVRQLPPECLHPHMKCRSRMHYFLAEKEVQANDPDAWALLLDQDGNVTETNAANFLMMKNGVLISPPLAKILDGISRRTAIELARHAGIVFTEKDIRLDDISNAEEAFLSSTGFCLMPVTKVNGVTVGDGKPGPIFHRLIELWSKNVGVDIWNQITQRAKSLPRS
jgi:branched-chain amino acid aminotransferase